MVARRCGSWRRVRERLKLANIERDDLAVNFATVEPITCDEERFVPAVFVQTHQRAICLGFRASEQPVEPRHYLRFLSHHRRLRYDQLRKQLNRKHLDDNDAGARAAAIVAMGHVEPSDLAEIVGRHPSDSHDTVREAVAMALLEVAGERTVGVALRLSRDPDAPHDSTAASELTLRRRWREKLGDALLGPNIVCQRR